MHFFEVLPFELRECLGSCSNPLCANFTHFASALHHKALREETLDVMAHYYGWSSFSVRNWVASALRDGMHLRQNVSECQFLGRLFVDHIHPTNLHSWFLADVLSQHFSDAAAYFDVAPEGLGYKLPGQPLTSQSSWAHSQKKCVAASALNVTAAHSWAYVDGEVVRRKKVYKPGWMTSAQDAFIEIGLSPTLVPFESERRVTLVFLQSYDVVMAAADLECNQGCVCDPIQLDGRCAGHASLHHSFSFNVQRPSADAAGCALRLSVRGTADAFKFKLLGLSV
jgi:hypothetical protein